MDVPFEEISLVHDVYSKIANSFDKTRKSIWKCVQNFLSKLDSSSKIIDCGCGNGKNVDFLLKKGFTNISSFDYCQEFVEMCLERGHNCFRGDVCNIPLTSNTFDAVLSIAVIHHLYGKDRIRQAISELIRITKPNGYILITVLSKEKHSECVNISKGLNDNTLKWTLPGETLQRYYYFFTLEELSELLNSFNITYEIKEEMGNWVIKIQRVF